MKPRKVVVMIEMTTAATLSALKSKQVWQDSGSEDFWDATFHQVQANVVKPEKGSKEQ